jgi:hypothetical protein
MCDAVLLYGRRSRPVRYLNSENSIERNNGKGITKKLNGNYYVLLAVVIM